MSGRRALLLLTTSFPDADDGSEAAGTFVADVARELAAAMPVHVVAPALRAGTARITGDFTVTRFAVPHLPLSTLKPGRASDAIAILQTLRAGRAAALRAAAELEATHTLALWALPSGYWARAVRRRFGIPYSTWALGSDIWSLGRVPLVRSMLARTLRGARHCYADGYALAAEVERLSGRACAFLASARRIDGAPRTHLREQPPYRLVFVGRWHPNKGPDLLLDALACLADDDWRRIESVSIYGGGELAGTIVAAVAALVRAGRPVTVGGFLGRERFRAALAASDILLIPSRIESIPVIFSDAMKLGCAVVATPVGDLRELVERYRVGTVADSAEPGAYAAAIRAILGESIGSYRDGLTAAASVFDHVEVAARIARDT